MRTALLILLLLSSAELIAQHDFFVLKKGNKTIATYHNGSFIAFRGEYEPWIAGTLQKINKDSFYVQSSIVHYYLMGSDTQYLPPVPYALSDIKYLPGKGVKIEYLKGQFRVNRGAGHVHFYWVKSGWLFRTLGIGYGALNLINSLVVKNMSFSWGAMGLAAGLFIAGKVLKHAWKFEMKIGKRYHFQVIRPDRK
jgi:hypothetical protein